MRIFYQSPTVLITDRAVTFTGSAKPSVRIDALDHLYVVRVDAHIPAGFLIRRLGPIAILILVATLAVARSAAADPLLVSVVPLLGFLAGMIAICGRVRSINELWAVVDDRHVLLYRDTDSGAFNQFRRAVVRAKQNRGSQHRGGRK